MRVEVYYNLTRSCWSVRALEGADKGKVFMYADSVAVENATFVVREGGRQRVIKEKQKNVHAFVRGTLTKSPRIAQRLLGAVTYNPYKNSTFVCRRTAEPVLTSPLVHLHADRKVTYIP